jgi:hypothetical protein
VPVDDASESLECIYSLDGDELKICSIRKRNGNRPDEFKTAPDSRRFMIVLKRENRRKARQSLHSLPLLLHLAIEGAEEAARTWRDSN